MRVRAFFESLANPKFGAVFTIGLFILTILHMDAVYKSGQMIPFIGLLALVVLVIWCWFFAGYNWKGPLVLLIINVAVAVCLLYGLMLLAAVPVLMLFFTGPHFWQSWKASRPSKAFA